MLLSWRFHVAFYLCICVCVCCVFLPHVMILLLCPPRIKHNLNDTVVPLINSSACQSVSYNPENPIARQGVMGTYAQQDLHVYEERVHFSCSNKDMFCLRKHIHKYGLNHNPGTALRSLFIFIADSWHGI